MEEEELDNIGQEAEQEAKPVSLRDDKPWSYTSVLGEDTHRLIPSGGRNLRKDAEEYRGYNITATNDLDWDWQRAKNQPVWDQVGGFITQAVAGEVVGGILEGYGNIWQIGADVAAEAGGENAEFNNSVVQMGADIREWSQDVAPIYRTNPDESFDMGNSGWWFSNAVSIASSFGLLIPAAGTVRAVGMFAKLLNIGGKIGKTAKLLAKAGIAAGVMRNGENLKESLHTVNEVRQDVLDKFNTPEKFKQYINSDEGKKVVGDMVSSGQESITPAGVADYIAASAGWRTYNVNAINIVSDFMQVLPIFRLSAGLGVTRAGSLVSHSSKVLKAQAKALGKGVAKRSTGDVVMGTVKALMGPGAIAREGLGEGGEEIVNAIGGKEGLRYGHMLMNDPSKEEQLNIGGRLTEYLSDGHTWEQAMWGAVGGLLFAGGARIANYKNIKNRNDESVSSISVREAQIEALTSDVLSVLNNDTANQKDAEGNIIKDDEGNPIKGDIESVAKADNMTVDEYKTAEVRRLLDPALREMALRESKTGTMDLLEQDFNEGNIGKLIDRISETVSDNSKANKYLSKSYMISQLKNTEKLYNQAYNQFNTKKNDKPEISNLIMGQFINTELDVQKADETISELERGIADETSSELIKQHRNKDAYFDSKLDNYGKIQAIHHYKDELAQLELRASKLGISLPDGVRSNLESRILGLEKEVADNIVAEKTANSESPASTLSEVTDETEKAKLKKSIDDEINNKSLNILTSEFLNKGLGMNTLQKLVDKELTKGYRDELLARLGEINSTEYRSKIEKDIEDRAKAYKKSSEELISEFFKDIKTLDELGTIEEVTLELKKVIPTIQDFEDLIKKEYDKSKERIVSNEEGEIVDVETEEVVDEEEVVDGEEIVDEVEDEVKDEVEDNEDTGNITFNHADGFGINSTKLWNNLPDSVLIELEKAINDPELYSVPYGYAVAMFDVHYDIKDDEISALANLTKPQIYAKLQEVMSNIKEGDNGRDVAVILRAMVMTLNITNLEFAYSNLNNSTTLEDTAPFGFVGGTEVVIPRVTLISDIRFITNTLIEAGYTPFNYSKGRISTFSKRFNDLYSRAFKKNVSNRTTEEYNAVRLVEIYDSLHDKDKLKYKQSVEIRLHAINNNLPPELQEYADTKRKSFTRKFSAEYIRKNTKDESKKKQWLDDANVTYTDEDIAFFVKHMKFDVLESIDDKIVPSGLHMASLSDYAIAKEISDALNISLAVSETMTGDEKVNISDFKIRYYKEIKLAELKHKQDVMKPAFEFLTNNQNTIKDIKESVSIWSSVMEKNVEQLSVIANDVQKQMNEGVAYNWIKVKGFNIFNKSRASFNYVHGVENELDILEIHKEELSRRIVIIGKKNQKIIENEFLNTPIETNDPAGFKQGVYIIMPGDNVSESPRLVRLTTRQINKQFSGAFRKDFNKILKDVANTDISSEQAISILAQEIEKVLGNYAVIHKYQISSKDTNFLGFKVNRNAYRNKYGSYIDLIEFAIHDTDSSYMRTDNNNFVHLTKHIVSEKKYKLIAYENGKIALIENNNFGEPIALIDNSLSAAEKSKQITTILDYMGNVKSSIDFSQNNVDPINMPRDEYLTAMNKLVSENIDKIVSNIRPVTLPNGRVTLFDMSTSSMSNKVNVQITNYNLDAIEANSLEGTEEEVIAESIKEGVTIEKVKVNSYIDIHSYLESEEVANILKSSKPKTIGGIMKAIYGDVNNSKYGPLYKKYKDLKVSYNGTSSKYAMQYKIGKNGQPNRVVVHGGLLTLTDRNDFNDIITELLTHELIHASINDNIFTPKIRERLNAIKVKLNQTDISAYFRRKAQELGVDEAKVNAMLGKSSVEEILTYAFTDSSIASILNTIGDVQNDKSILTQLLEVLTEILQSIGIVNDSLLGELHSIVNTYGITMMDNTAEQTKENIEFIDDTESETEDDIKLPSIEDIPMGEIPEGIDFETDDIGMFAVVDGITPIIQNNEMELDVTKEDELNICN